MNKEKLKKFVKSIPDFSELLLEDQIVYFGYYLENQEKLESFKHLNIDECFLNTSLPKPLNIISRLKKLVAKPKKRLIVYKGGYRVSYNEGIKLDEIVKGDIPYLSISKTLNDLPKVLSKSAEQSLLREAIKCYRIKAWRAVLVLVWILTMDHMQDYIIKNKLKKFNVALQANPKYHCQITKKEDFEAVKESDFILVLRQTNLISKNQKKILDNKLDIRNSYAHPSTLTLNQSKTLDFIEDLINNVVSTIK